MCGIAGYYRGGSRPWNPRIIEDMTSAILHRGPDSAGHWQDQDVGIALGMRRLAILDLSPAGEQPMTSADGRFVMVYNGEIYNHREIRAELEVANLSPRWRGHADTEVLLAAISAWGIEPTLQKCNGMLGLALWDRRERTLHLAVDRFGEKPLYYGWVNNTFLFGSELKALKAHPEWSPTIDANALALYFRFAYVPAPHSIFQGFRKLEPGTMATLRRPNVTGQQPMPHIFPYWSAREAVIAAKRDPLNIPYAEATAEMEKALARAVKLRMEADVPLGAFLSGGFDSTAVVAMMQTNSNNPVRTFSIGLTEQGYNEAPFAKRVAEHLGTDHSELYVTPRQAMDVIPLLPAMYDEPFADSSQIPTYLVSRMARQNVTVALSGDGGDELLGGYNRYFVSNRVLPLITSLPMGLRKIAASAIRSVGAEGLKTLYSIAMLGRTDALVGDRAIKFANLLTLASPLDGYRALVSAWQNPREIVPGAFEPPTAIDRPEFVPSGLSFVEQMMFLDLITYLPGDILTKVDRATMAVSLEGRIPFIDPELLHFAWRLPLPFKVQGGVGKRILRELVYKHVPRDLMDRPKTGFGIPMKDWLKGALRSWAETLLQSDILEDAGLNPSVTMQIWKEHLTGVRNWQSIIWPVIMYLAWKRDFFDS